MGPGEAKGELKARLERRGLGARIVGVETVDKMTDRQIAAKAPVARPHEAGDALRAPPTPGTRGPSHTWAPSPERVC